MGEGRGGGIADVGEPLGGCWLGRTQGSPLRLTGGDKPHPYDTRRRDSESGRTMRIDGRTKIVGVIGHPVNHTLSPAMHNAAFSALDMNWAYLAFDVAPEALETAVRGLAALGIVGLNCTVPHKERAIPLLDDISQEARATGSVNTIEVRDRKLFGYSTDGEGFLRSLNDDLGLNPAGMSVVLLGSGGAARAIVVALEFARAATVRVANRTLSRAEKLCSDLAGFSKNTALVPVPLQGNAIKKAIKEAHLVVNATSLGWRADDPLPIDPTTLHDKLAVLDTCYRTEGTALLKAAQERGLRSANGLGMLVYQGAASFRIWTARDAPVEVMRRAVEEASRHE